jgi:hypothetical protein
VADATGGDAHGYLAGGRGGQLDVLDYELISKSMAHCCAHWVSNNARRLGFAT